MGLELGGGQLGRLPMLAKEVARWLLEDAAGLLFAQKVLLGMGATGMPLMAEKATLVLAVYRAVRGLIIAGETLNCILLEQDGCPARVASVGMDEETSSLMGGRAMWKTVLEVTVAVVLVSTRMPEGWDGFAIRSSAGAWTNLDRGPK